MSMTAFEQTCTEVTVFLQNGVKLTGEITGLDTDGSYLLARDGNVQKVMRHAVATIMRGIVTPGMEYEPRTFQRGQR